MRPELAIALILAAGSAVAEPRFERRNAELSHQYTGGWEHFVGGGVAAFDCNGDDLPEVYAAGGENPASLLHNTTEGPGATLDFTTETPPELALTGVIGAYPLDIDGDGQLDLAILRVGENRLLRGLDACRFEAFTGIEVASGNGWTTAFSATWEADQSLPTLAFGNYVDRDDPDGPFEACDDHQLFRPEGDGYGSPQTLSPGFCTLSMLFTDWNRSGRADLRVSNDRHYYVSGGAEQMWAMEATPRLFTEADGWRDHHLWGMGIASRDLDGDGVPEVLLSSMGDQRLQSRLPGTTGPTYQDARYDRGTTAHRPFTGGDGRPSTGWHVAFGDVQNDGLDDIFIAKGNVEQMPDAAMDDPNNLLIQQTDGSFSEAGLNAGIATLDRSRGAVLADLNLDGLLDLAVVNRRAPIEIWQNVASQTGNWISLELGQTAPNRRAVGSWIEVRTDGSTQTREITIGGGHAGGSAVPEHFGLGEAEDADVRVIWPDGAVSDWVEIGVNNRWKLLRDGGGLILTRH